MVQRAGSLVARRVTALRVISLAAALAALSACGQKGPLTLPAPAAPPSAAAASAPAR